MLRMCDCVTGALCARTPLNPAQCFAALPPHPPLPAILPPSNPRLGVKLCLCSQLYWSMATVRHYDPVLMDRMKAGLQEMSGARGGGAGIKTKVRGGG